jgi:polysaccharide pyruvyl transferase WcaK-like protein
MGYRGPVEIAPDLAFSLRPEPIGTESDFVGGNTVVRTVAINAMPVYDKRYWPIVDDNLASAYKAKMLEMTEALLDKGWHCVYFAMQRKDGMLGREVVRELRRMKGFQETELRFVQSETVNQVFETVSGADILISTRFHATLLPLLVPRPVVAICYHHKARELMERMGQSDYAVPLETFQVDDLLQRFEALWSHRTEECKKITDVAQSYRKALSLQYDRLLSVDQI